MTVKWFYIILIERGNMQNLEGGVNVCLELLYAMMKRFLEMT